MAVRCSVAEASLMRAIECASRTGVLLRATYGPSPAISAAACEPGFGSKPPLASIVLPTAHATLVRMDRNAARSASSATVGSYGSEGPARETRFCRDLLLQSGRALLGLGTGVLIG